jgi:hypothetical protein
VAAAAGEPFLGEALRLASAFCGVELVRVPPGTESDLAYVEDREDCKAAIRIPRVRAYTETEVPPVPTDSDMERSCSTGRFPFDLVAAVRFWIADQGNADAPNTAFDRHDRLRPAASVQSRLGVLEIPIVNAYLLLLRGVLERRLRVETRSFLPEGKRCVLLLTHDVDRPLDPGGLRHSLPLAGRALAKGRVSAVPYLGFALAKGASARLRDPTGRHWLFDEVAAAEREHGFRSTFFFAPTSRFSRRGHHLDVGYDVAHPPFPELCRSLARASFEIGLHVGVRSGQRAEWISAERERLSLVSGVDVRASRHHYWHLGRNFWRTLERHTAAGIEHDLSTAFADSAGYRLGIAFPHRPWNPDSGEPIATLQMPTVAMDGAFFYEPGATVEGSLERLESLIETMKRFEGVAAIDWHQETSFPASQRFAKWGRCYLALLDLLAADPDVAVLTAGEVADAALSGRRLSS